MVRSSVDQRELHEMHAKYVVLVVAVYFGLVSCDDAAKKSAFKRALVKDCVNSYSVTCLKLDIVSWVDTLNEEGDYNVLPGVTLVKENASAPANTADIVAELAREFPNDADARLDAFLLKKVSGFLSSHSIKVHLFDGQNQVTARGKGGKKGGYGYLLAAGAMMKGTMMAVALGALAALAGKALMTGLISLMLSAIIGIKSLAGGGKSTTYEIVSKPVYSHSSSHSSSHEDHHGGGGGGGGGYGYGRSFDLPLPLGLQPGYRP